MKLGILTGGGDAPGLNAVIRGFTLEADRLGHRVVGLRYGWKGLLDQVLVDLDADAVRDIHRMGGTILNTSRTNPVKDEQVEQRALDAWRQLGLDGLVAVGGDDTLGACARLSGKGVKAIGVPKTIDNDIQGTDVTFGFDTAVNIATEALDRLHTTAASHERVLVVEIMGRHAGHIAWAAGIAGGAHVTLLPEDPFDIAAVATAIRRRYDGGHRYAIVAVAEGAKPSNSSALALQDEGRDEFGNVRLGGIADQVARAIERETGYQTRSVVLGHLQRGGAPSAFDRVLGTRLGAAAAGLASDEKWGVMVSVRGNRLEPVPLEEAAKGYRVVSDADRELGRNLWGN